MTPDAFRDALQLATGTGFLLGRSEAFAGLATFTLVILLLGMVSTWELMTWMAVKVNGPGQ